MRNGAIALLIFLGLGAVVYFGVIKPQQQASSTTPGENATSTTSTSTAGIITPDYKKPIAFSGSFSEDIRSQINDQLSRIQAQIEKNKLNLAAWVDLGAIHKMGGDYAFAVEAWEFVTGVYSSNPVAFYNLGDLYQNFLKDYPKAEANYIKSIEIMPKNIQAYSSLFTLYHYQYKVGTGADAAILERGLKSNPNDPTLLELKKDL